MKYTEMSNAELEEANQALMRERARIKDEQKSITAVLDERLDRGYDLEVSHGPFGRRRAKMVWTDPDKQGQTVTPVGFEVPK